MNKKNFYDTFAVDIANLYFETNVHMGVASFRRLYPIDCGLQWRQITLPLLSVPNDNICISFLPVLLCWGFLAWMLLLASRSWLMSTFLSPYTFQIFPYLHRIAHRAPLSAGRDTERLWYAMDSESIKNWTPILHQEGARPKHAAGAPWKWGEIPAYNSTIIRGKWHEWLVKWLSDCWYEHKKLYK